MREINSGVGRSLFCLVRRLSRQEFVQTFLVSPRRIESHDLPACIINALLPRLPRQRFGKPEISFSVPSQSHGISEPFDRFGHPVLYQPQASFNFGAEGGAAYQRVRFEVAL